MKKTILALAFGALGFASATAEVTLPAIFSDNMVLQQQTDAPIWGEAMPGAKVIVTTSWDKKKYTVTAGADGKWMAKMATPKAGGPYKVTVSDGKKLTLDNVMIGEVWICSGQSNMEMQVEGWGKINNYEQEKEWANQYPNIRFLQAKRVTSPRPLDEVAVNNGGWQVCSAKTVADFSATAYFFGRDINKYQDVPVGLIDTSWGGTIIEAWTSKEALATLPDMVPNLACLEDMPLTPEERNQKFEDDLVKWQKNLDNLDRGSKDGKALWAAGDFDDSDWDAYNVPGWIQDQGLKAFNGIYWCRREIDIPQSWAGKKLTLNLGVIDDNDFTFFNGKVVGHTEGWMAGRSYEVPAEMVKAGKAVVAVRIMDTGGNGGMGGSPESINIKCGDETISLAGEWKGKASLMLTEVPAMPVNAAWNPNVPTFLYNSMLKPLAPYAIKGAIWYQGESNAPQAYQYRELMPLMITDWRNLWGYEFPFYMVQLAAFTSQEAVPVESNWAELREAQTMATRLRGVGMAVAIDIGDALDIHPKNKQEVGRRLALAARAQAYGENISYSGPMYDRYVVEGNSIRLYFDHVDGGLTTPDGETLKGFAIAGLDRKFHWAEARIDGNTVVVSSPDVAMPVAVRYAWADNPVCNLYNGEGLPASPFRTDDWQGITYGAKR